MSTSCSADYVQQALDDLDKARERAGDALRVNAAPAVDIPWRLVMP
jgi:hypothetical protein